jgi:hypothetical protein
MNETEPMPFGERRQHRKLLRFDPTISSGQLIQIFTLMGGLFVAWGTYQADRTTTKLEIEQIKINAAADKVLAKEAVVEMRAEIRKVQDTITSVDKAVTSIQAEIGAKRPAR